MARTARTRRKPNCMADSPPGGAKCGSLAVRTHICFSSRSSSKVKPSHSPKRYSDKSGSTCTGSSPSAVARAAAVCRARVSELL